MAGIQVTPRQSLQWQLSVWLSLAITAVAIVAGALSFYSSFSEANDLQDDQLRQMAALIDQHNLPLRNRLAEAHARNQDAESKIVVEALGQTAMASDDTAILKLPDDLPEGIQTRVVDQESWRLYVQTLHSGQRLAVGQQTAVRDENAYNSATHTLLPLLILMPMLVGLVSLLIKRMLAPITHLSGELDKRSEFDLACLSDDGVPEEIRPFIAAMNRLLGRLAQAMEAQRRFVADAAHELRTPLTALSLQLENLENRTENDGERAPLQPLRKGVQRAKAMLEQLLSLARAQAAAPRERASTSLKSVVRRVLEDLWPQASAKQIDIGVLPDGEVHVSIQEFELYALVRNLVDNAIRYTPAGGRIDLWAYKRMGKPILEVSDTGPGIPASEMDRIFDPFYRVLGNEAEGSGLGLAIVRTIAERTGAELELKESGLEASTPGLRVVVRWPMQPA